MTRSVGVEALRTRAPMAGLAALAVAVAYSGWASGTRPFTDPGDVAVSIPSAVFALAFLLERRWPGRGPWRRLPSERPVREGSAVLWVAVAFALVAIELASYFHGGPRSHYPTISSGLDSLFNYRAAKAATYFVWLVVGGYLVRR